MTANSKDKVLLVDDDPNILAAYERQLRRRFSIETANGAEEALAKMEAERPFAVVVSDLRMPVMDGIQFLGIVRKRSPDTVRVMLTGQADLNAAVAAVNEGNIFRFLTKPCPPSLFTKAIEDSLEQYRLITAERELLEETLSGSIKVFVEILSLVSPAAFSRATRIKRYVGAMAAELGLSNKWQFTVAAMFSQIGCVALPTELLEKAFAGRPLSGAERALFSNHPLVGASLLKRIPRLSPIARMVEWQERSYDSYPPAQRDFNDPVALGAQILKVALDFDRLISAGLSENAAIAQLKETPEKYNPVLLRALQACREAEADSEKRSLRVEQLAVGMILEEEVMAGNGLLLVPKGQEVTPAVLERIRNFKGTIGIVEPICVRIPVKKAEAAPRERSPA